MTKVLMIYLMLLCLSACGNMYTTDSVQGLKGEKGDSGERGSDGSVGPTGPAGTPGESIVGPKGEDGTVVTLVQLCPGTTTYSTTFVEVAMCINKKLYGVYSANNGFMTYFPPGTYHSQAIGSACNLVIKENCVVESVP